MTVTEQSHLNCCWCYILISHGLTLLGYAFCFIDLLLFLSSDCHSYAIFGIWSRFRIAHFSAFNDFLDADTFPSAESTWYIPFELEIWILSINNSPSMILNCL